ncbi:MAG: DnaB-like helicase C-terminal domain-containing protein [Bacteroidales bacterium]
MTQGIISKIQAIIGNQNADEKEIVFRIKEVIYESESQNKLPKESKSIATLVAENLKLLKDETRKDNLIKTGFTEFDKMFAGFALGEMVVIGARPSMGKTQLLVNICLNIAASTPVLYCSLDLSEFLLTNKFISSLSRIALNKILQYELTDEEKNKLQSIENNFNKYKIFVNDSYCGSFTALKAYCENQIQENGVRVIVVDYLQLISSSKHRNSRELEISYISRELKNIAKTFNVCVIATSQLSRAVEMRGGGYYPRLSDLRESGAIEQDADKVIFIYRPEYYGVECDEEGNSTTGLTELILAKNRHGGVGTVKLLRDENFTNYSDFDGYRSDFSFSKSRLDEVDSPF